MSSTPHVLASSNLPRYRTFAIVAMDRSSSSRTFLSSRLLLSKMKSLNKGFERSLESVLHASKQKATAIESMLRGLEISEKQNPSGPPVFTSPIRPAAVPSGHLLQLHSLLLSLQVHLCPHLHPSISLMGQLSFNTKFQMLLRRRRESLCVLFSARKVLKQKKQANVPNLGFGALVSPGREVVPIYVLLSR
ncbi:hypothetical protein Pint_04228 [Pistacia integerrima]|uniref:Uncharacterized protein n=1 Tax=Pistacia integerrima TaxID=434235 RepID=A0ACC0Z8E6_9ROSI|nr:hypothetical protein Pint_04228 [Pistacia integerrima]